MDVSILEDIGLTKAETKAYLTLLELGPSTSGPVISASGMQSSVVHRSLKQLIEKGLVSSVRIGKNNRYQATDPASLVHYIEDKRKRLQDIVPELRARQYRAADRNETEMYIGKRAIFTMLNSLISDGRRREEYCSFSLGEEHDDPEIVKFYHNHNRRREELRLRVKVLSNRSVRRIYERNYDHEILRKAHVRYTAMQFPQGIIIFRDIVIFLTWQERPTAVRITNALMAKQFRSFFLAAYNKEKDAY